MLYFEQGWLPLHWATYYGNQRVLVHELAAGVDINAKSVLGDAPIHLSVTNKKISR